MYYVDIAYGRMVNSTGAPTCERLRFVEAQTQNFVFRPLVGGQAVPATWLAASFYLTGATEYKSASPAFRATGTVNTDGTISFAVDTYTEQYFATVLRPGTAMYVELTRKIAGAERDERVALMECLADPRVYVPGVPPAPISAYYTAAQADARFVIVGGTAGQVPEKQADGSVKWKDPVGGKVQSVNGKTGAVVLNASDVGAVPVSRKVNGKALADDITLNASDVGAMQSVSGGTAGQVLTKGADGTNAFADPPAESVSDVQVNGTSILSGGVANIPLGDYLRYATPFSHDSPSPIEWTYKNQAGQSKTVLSFNSVGNYPTTLCGAGGIVRFECYEVQFAAWGKISNNGRSLNTAGGFCVSDATTGNITSPGALISKGGYFEALNTTSISAIPAVEGKVYTHTLASDVTVNFGTPQTGYAPTFEVWLDMGATVYAITWGATILWDDGSGNFAAATSAPSLADANKRYYLVFRWDGTNWLGNLTGTKALA